MNNRITKTMRAKAGFTLVELIVVIAILGILAGVGTVGYSGYIKKANMAADEQLLSYVNQAFATACNLNGESNFGRTDSPSITITDDGTVDVDALSTGSDEVNESFAAFFEGGVFKVMTELYYDGSLGVFKDLTNNIFGQIFSGLDLGSYVDTFKKSVFYKIGSADLMSKVDDVTGMVANFFNNGDSGSQLMAALMGADIDGLVTAYGMNSQEELQAYLRTLSNEDRNELFANYAVLLVADTMSTDSTDWLTDLQNGITTDDIKALIKADDSASSKQGVAKAALLYAMYTSYANGLEPGDTKTAALKNLGSMDTFVQNINDEGFTAYLNDTNSTAQTDLEAFIAAMGIITESTDNNPEATKTLLDGGYNNTELIGALQSLLGN